MPHQKFSDIVGPVDAGRRERVATIKAAMDDVVALAELRKERGATQAQVAVALGVTQGNISHLERSRNLYLDTLREYVEALGGRLELFAVFDDGHRVDLTPPSAVETPPAREAVAAS